MTKSERIRLIRQKKTLEQRDMCIMDRPMFQKIFEDKHLAQSLLNAMMLRDDIVLKDVRTGVPLAECGGDPKSRDRFTVLALGEGNALFNLEPFPDYWESQDFMDVLTLADRHADRMDALLIADREGVERPESWVVLITVNDLLHSGRPIAQIKRITTEGEFVGHTQVMMVNLAALHEDPPEA